MGVPDFQSLMLPLLKLAGDGQEHTPAEAVERLAREFQLSDDDRRELLPSGGQPRFIGPISDDVRAALGAEAEDDEEFKKMTRSRSKGRTGVPARGWEGGVPER